MLHDLDLVSVHEVRSKVDKPYRTRRSCKSFSQARVDFAREAAQTAGDQDAGGNSHPRRHRWRRSSDLFLKNEPQAVVAQGGKMYIGPRTIVTPGARRLAARHDILVLAQR